MNNVANNDKPMYRLGIDAGSASLAVVLMDCKDNRIVEKGYCLHHGDMRGAVYSLLETMLQQADETALCRAAACGVNRDCVNAYNVNEITALIAGARFAAPSASSVVEIGGQSSKYVAGLRGGNIQFAVNDTCSAGTGSFFEAQAGRLNIALDDFAALTDKADAAPRIAGRCGVFAKTDIIHLQQAGEHIENILLGLCYATARNYKASVAGKLPQQPPALFAGGTVYNRGMVRAVRDVLGLGNDGLIVSEYSPYLNAIGAALCAGDAAGRPIAELRETLMQDGSNVQQDESGSLPPLAAFEEIAQNAQGMGGARSGHAVGVAGAVAEPRTARSGACAGCAQIQHKTHKIYPFTQNEPCFLGIDIGSTSTNIVLLDQQCRVVDYQYLRTKGDPKNAVKEGFASIAARFGKELAVIGAAATGSGRHFIGSLIGADGIYDEISAQAAAALHFCPDTDTIFEIGGQDSKYISIKDAAVADFQMNKICAAGTGSFIEEQAQKLRLPLEQFEAAALSAHAPCGLGERCTVFIETNINKALSKGASKEDVAAGLCYSVVKNYLHRVVANKPVGKRILLQGGVAHNSALVAAFKKEFGSRIEAAPYFSVSGAIGAALMIKQKSVKTTMFKGISCLENDEAQPEIKAPAAPLPKAAVDPLLFDYQNVIDPNKKTIGIPRALVIHSFFPVFNAFFRALGYNVLISDVSGEEIIELSQSYTKVETCYPVKLAIGHAAQLADRGVDYLFFPSLYALGKPPPKAPPARLCVYMQKAPQILAASLGLAERGVTLLTMDIDLSKGYGSFIAALYRLGRQLRRNPLQCLNSVKKGMDSMVGFMRRAYKKHRKHPHQKIADKTAAAAPEFAILARGYCIVDPALNLGLKSMLEERGCKASYGVHNHHSLNIYEQYPNLYWSFGTYVVAAAKIILGKPGLYAIHPTYHGCAPDGMLSHWFEDEAGAKPYLPLEIDEHASKVGVITRLEAFVNSVHSYENSASKQEQGAPLMRDISGFHTEITALDKNRPAIIPYFRPYSALFAAYLRGMGYNARELPPTSPESLAKGRSFMRGKEYFSLTALLGDAAVYAETHFNAQLLFPQTGGFEVDGLYSYFVYTKLKNRLAVISPELDRVLEQKAAADALFRVLLAGDIALYSGSGDLARFMAAAFEGGLPDDETLMRWAGSGGGSGKSILFIGEPWCIHNALFQSMVVQEVTAAGIRAVFAPLSETALFERHGLGLSKRAAKFEKLMQAVSCVMGVNSIFSPSLAHLKKAADESCGNFSGGFGRYRSAKAASYGAPLVGVISAASLYENTGSILELLCNNRRIPFLSLQFDGEQNPVNRLKIESFLDELSRPPTN